MHAHSTKRGSMRKQAQAKPYSIAFLWVPYSCRRFHATANIRCTLQYILNQGKFWRNLVWKNKKCSKPQTSLSWISPIFQNKKGNDLVGRGPRFALVVWEPMHLLDETWPKTCSTRWNSSPLYGNLNGKLNVSSSHGMLMFSNVFRGFPIIFWQTIGNVLAEIEFSIIFLSADVLEPRFVVNGSFIALIILKLIKRLFECH